MCGVQSFVQLANVPTSATLYMCICTRLSLAEEAVTESDVQEGGGAVISTDQKHYKLLADAIEAASEVTSEKRASKRVRDETNYLIF